MLVTRLSRLGPASLGNKGIWGVDGFFYCSDVVKEIPPCRVAVISNPTVYNASVFHAAVFGELKLFAVLGFLVRPLSNLHLT